MTDERAWSTIDFEDVARRVQARAGLVFNPEMRPTVEARIRQAMREESVESVGEYLALLSTKVGALDGLVERLTIGETYFFREPEQLEYIRSTVLPNLARHSAGAPLQFWSAGCASGEEAYSLAILVREAGLGRAAVLGTDFSAERLTQARKGEYSRWSLRGVPEPIVQRYFRAAGGRFRLAPEIRSAVTFRQLNLLDRSYPLAALSGRMDLILCRNVLIYLSPDAVAEIAGRLIASLSQDGWLVLGASDPQLGDLVPCEVVVTGAGIAYRRRRRGRAAFVPRATNRAVGSPLPPVQKTEAVPASPKLPTSTGGRSGPGGASRGRGAVAGSTVATADSGVAGPGISAAESGVSGPGISAAESAFAARNYARCAELSARLLETDPGDPNLWVLRIRALARQGDLQAAGRACSAALEAHRTSPELMCLHAVLLSAAGHPAEAALAARRALYLDRALTMAHIVLGHALLRTGDRPRARRALQTAEEQLTQLAPEAVVPTSDGEPAARLLELVRRQLDLAAA